MAGAAYHERAYDRFVRLQRCMMMIERGRTHFTQTNVLVLPKLNPLVNHEPRVTWVQTRFDRNV